MVMKTPSMPQYHRPAQPTAPPGRDTEHNIKAKYDSKNTIKVKQPALSIISLDMGNPY